MKEIRFSNQNMQNYYNEIMNMETSELNLTELGRSRPSSIGG